LPLGPPRGNIDLPLFLDPSMYVLCPFVYMRRGVGLCRTPFILALLCDANRCIYGAVAGQGALLIIPVYRV
jgi:hypothetical protein